MHTLPFTLRQHTPLIHFQHEQEGATLRASEVKPKLDKYITEYYFNNNTEAYEKYLLNKKQSLTALNYKLIITAQGEPTKYVFASQKVRENDIRFWQGKGYTLIGETPFFANEKGLRDREEKEIRFALQHEAIKIRFVSPFQDLLDIITENIDSFLLMNNFGTRQNKGFGSFSRQEFLQPEKNGETIDEKCLKIFYTDGFDLVFSHQINHTNSITDAFATINKEYKLLKAGIADTPSKLKQHYANLEIEGEPIIWEKSPVNTQIIYNRNNPNEIKYKAEPNERYIRVLLGLAELHDYAQFEAKVKIKSLDSSIERIASPLFFKVVENKIYLLAKEIPPEVYNKPFLFSMDNKSVKISSPPSNMALNLNEFLKKYLHNSWKRIDLQKLYQ